MRWEEITTKHRDPQEQALAVLRDFANAYQRQNLKAVLKAFASDAQVVAADGEEYWGPIELADRFTSEFQTKLAKQIKSKALSVTIEGEAVFVSSTYEMLVLERGTQISQHVSGEFRAELMCKGGDWRISRAQFRA